ncbi:MAG: T9SS type A sorting domain-containing protein [Saprospiraceae bacterium]|nr:T9SS type A sorting domain-containing protein [Candidatus Vicinibacter affinis]
MDPESKYLVYVFRHVYSTQYTTDNYIYTYNDSLEQLSKIKVKNIQRPLTIRYVTFRKGFYHLFGDELEFKENKLTNKGWLIYLKVDTLGKIVRENKLIEPGNVNTNGGFTYTIASDGSDGYYIVTNDWVLTNDIDPWKSIPYVYHVSAELDTVYLRTRFQDPLIMLGQNSSVITCMTTQRDKSGLVTCGSLNTPPNYEPDYGWLFKCSLKGDSLWTRKLQPLGWDSARAWWISLESIRTTPYNTLVVCGRVSDQNDRMIKGWLLHLDSEGCLVPGCEKVVSNTDIHSGKEKAFAIFPNPSVSNHLYLLSRIGDHSRFILDLIDLSGKVLHTSHFNPQQGVKYIMEVPNELGNGEYILKIQGKEIQQTEKIVILR